MPLGRVCIGLRISDGNADTRLARPGRIIDGHSKHQRLWSRHIRRARQWPCLRKSDVKLDARSTGLHLLGMGFDVGDTGLGMLDGGDPTLEMLS